MFFEMEEKKPLSQTDRNLTIAFLGEAEANRKYTAYAMKAFEEGYPEIAQIFMEVAGGETIHALNHLRVMKTVKTTRENLQAVIESEAYEGETMYPKMIAEAEAEGRHDAAASFRLAWERERYHRRMFEEALEFLAQRGSPPPPPTEATALPWGDVSVPPYALEEIETERERIASRVRVREVVFGAQDGLISTVTLIAGVFAATTQNSIVLIAGLAGAVAGMLSMAAGAYLSSKSEREVYLAELASERREVEESPEEELAELRAIYAKEGWDEREIEQLVQKVSADKDLWLKTLSEKELGIGSAHLSLNPLKDAAAMGLSFFVGALIPVVPFLIISGLPALVTSVIATAAALFGVGVYKALSGHRRIVPSGAEVTIIGAFSAGVGYLLGTVLPGLLGVQLP